MPPIVVSGIGTEVGKTVISAILVEALEADYWKPIQTGLEKDSDTISRLITNTKCQIHKEDYHFKKPISPHAAGQVVSLSLPKTENLLIIEGCGGLFTPINEESLLIDYFNLWNPYWIVVSRHYLGSLNHTLLTLEALKKRNQCLLGIIFNGDPTPTSESFILNYTKEKKLAHINFEKQINKDIIQCYAKKLKPSLEKIIPLSGIPLRNQKLKSRPSYLLKERAAIS